MIKNPIFGVHQKSQNMEQITKGQETETPSIKKIPPRDFSSHIKSGVDKLKALDEKYTFSAKVYIDLLDIILETGAEAKTNGIEFMKELNKFHA